MCKNTTRLFWAHLTDRCSPSKWCWQVIPCVWFAYRKKRSCLIAIGAIVRMPLKGRDGLVEINSNECEGSLSAGGADDADPSAYDLAKGHAGTAISLAVRASSSTVSRTKAVYVHHEYAVTVSGAYSPTSIRQN